MSLYDLHHLADVHAHTLRQLGRRGPEGLQEPICEELDWVGVDRSSQHLLTAGVGARTQREHLQAHTGSTRPL